MKQGRKPLAKGLYVAIWLAGWLIAGWAGLALGQNMFAQPAPLGEPLPPVKMQWEIISREEADEASVIEKRTPDVWLEFLAFQPDGTPPLRTTYNSERANFSIGHFHGTEMWVHGPAEFAERFVDAMALVRLDQPLVRFEYRLPPRRVGEKVHEYVARWQHQLQDAGGELVGNFEPVEYPAYKFEHFEYTLSNDEGDSVSHFIYAGPFGRRVLVLDYVTMPELHERARPFVEKILTSFKPGWELKKLMLKEDPRYGELAGTPLAGQEVILPLAK